MFPSRTLFADRREAGRVLARRLLRFKGERPVILALPRGGVPVAPLDAIERLRPQVDEVVCLATPRVFGAIGTFYEDFRQLSDEEVVDLLRRATLSKRDSSAPPS